MMAAWYHPFLSTCATSFPKRFIAKCFPVFLVLTCCKHQFIRNCHQHFSSPWQQCLSKRPALSISLTRYSLGFLKGFFYMIWDMNHTGMCGYTIMSPTSGTSHQWEEAQSQLANLEILQVEINHPFPTSAFRRAQLWNDTFSIYPHGSC